MGSRIAKTLPFSALFFCLCVCLGQQLFVFLGVCAARYFVCLNLVASSGTVDCVEGLVSEMTRRVLEWGLTVVCEM